MLGAIDAAQIVQFRQRRGLQPWQQSGGADPDPRVMIRWLECAWSFGTTDVEVTAPDGLDKCCFVNSRPATFARFVANVCRWRLMNQLAMRTREHSASGMKDMVGISPGVDYHATLGQMEHFFCHSNHKYLP